VSKHVFVQNCPALSYMALGDAAVRIAALDHIIRRHRLDAFVVVARNGLEPLWQAVFGDRVGQQIPPAFADARVSRPTALDWGMGAAAWNVFESVFWENGFFDTAGLYLAPPCVFRCEPTARAVMIYPEERTDGNRVLTAEWWQRQVGQFRQAGFRIHALWSRQYAHLQKAYEVLRPDREFPATIDGLRRCIAESSLAVGGSTGPTWACLLSDIPQVVVETKKSPHGYWFFDRCQQVLAKRLHRLNTTEALLYDVGRW
jgi:hypothetical protein